MILDFIKNIFSSNNEDSSEDDLKKLFEKKDDKKDKSTGEKEKTNDDKKAEKDWFGQRVYDDDGEKINTVISMLFSCLNPIQWTSSNFKLPNFHPPKETPLDTGTIKRIQNAKENERILLSSVKENEKESKSNINIFSKAEQRQKELKSSNINILSKSRGQYK